MQKAEAQDIRARIVIRDASASMTTSVSEARKALEAIDVRMMNKPITLVQQRLYDVWVAFAQVDPDSRKADTNIFEFPLDGVVAACGMADTYNRKFFDETALGLMDLRVTYGGFFTEPDATVRRSRIRAGTGRSSKTRIVAMQLVSFVEIDSARNVIRVEFPEVIRKQILEPGFYRRIDLEIQRQLSTRTAIALYQCSREFASAQASPWLPWQEYSAFLGGTPEPHASVRDFVKVLNRAVPQVNQVNPDHRIEVEFTKSGRSFDQMRIVTALKHQRELDLVEALNIEVPDDVLALSTELRIPAPTISKHLKDGIPVDYLRAQLLYTRGRIGRRDQAPVSSPAAFFSAAVNQNYAAWRSPDPVAQRQTTPALDSRLTEIAPATSQKTLAVLIPSKPDIRVHFEGLKESDRANLAARFYASAGGTLQKKISTSGLGSPLVAKLFDAWLAKELAPEK